jgi:DNA-binding transcriptional MerR regulator
MTEENIRHLPRIGIGEAMRLYGMTARAIRFYEEKRLVEARRDRLNRRYYDHEARERLAWIGSLRQAGLSLPDIQHVLEAREDARHGRARTVLEQRRWSLELDMARLEVVAAGLASSCHERRVAVR